MESRGFIDRWVVASSSIVERWIHRGIKIKKLISQLSFSYRWRFLAFVVDDDFDNRFCRFSGAGDECFRILVRLPRQKATQSQAINITSSTAFPPKQSILSPFTGLFHSFPLVLTIPFPVTLLDPSWSLTFFSWSLCAHVTF